MSLPNDAPQGVREYYAGGHRRIVGGIPVRLASRPGPTYSAMLRRSEYKLGTHRG